MPPHETIIHEETEAPEAPEALEPCIPEGLQEWLLDTGEMILEAGLEFGLWLGVAALFGLVS